MGVWRAVLCCGVMLVPGGCVHTSSATADKPTVRTKGGDSATARIPILIAEGKLVEAEQILLHAIAAGLLSREAATRWQEAIRQRREQQSQQTGPKRPPPRVDPEDPSGERRNCGTALPNHPVCQDLPENYTYHSAHQALGVMKQSLGVKDLILHKPADTVTGPCPFLGKHFNVRSNGERAGSIVCCPCCVDADPRPIEWTRCQIVW